MSDETGNHQDEHFATFQQMLQPDYLRMQNAVAPFANSGEVQPALLASTLRSEFLLVEIRDLLQAIAENTTKPKRGRPPKES